MLQPAIPGKRFLTDFEESFLFLEGGIFLAKLAHPGIPLFLQRPALACNKQTRPNLIRPARVDSDGSLGSSEVGHHRGGSDRCAEQNTH